jgi:hypothetical protein
MSASVEIAYTMPIAEYEAKEDSNTKLEWNNERENERQREKWRNEKEE